VAGVQARDGYQFQLMQAQLKLKDQLIEKLKLENGKAVEEKDLFRNKLAQMQKESQTYRERIDR
jgi:hypothetical protein